MRGVTNEHPTDPRPGAASLANHLASPVRSLGGAVLMRSVDAHRPGQPPRAWERARDLYDIAQTAYTCRYTGLFGMS
jgi:hypothetical protein